MTRLFCLQGVIKTNKMSTSSHNKMSPLIIKIKNAIMHSSQISLLFFPLGRLTDDRSRNWFNICGLNNTITENNKIPIHGPV